ncbi:Ovca2 [Symbiodinium microadriaticum]|nr:Ovca2 [Symbiodinium microadriaticum]
MLGMSMADKVVDSELFLAGRERQVEGEILGRQDGDARKLFPTYTHASPAATGEVSINGKVLQLWTFSQLETLNQSALRKRALAIRDAIGEAACPSLPSGRCDDLTRWILQMQEQLTNEKPEQGRSGGYGTGHFVPRSFAQETKALASHKCSSVAEEVNACRDNYKDLKMQQNDFKEDPRLGIQTGRAGGEGKRHLFPKQNMVTHGVSAAEPQGIASLRPTPEGRRYIPTVDNLMEQKRENEARERALMAGGAAGPAPVNRPANHISEDHMAHFGCTNEDEPSLGGRRHANKPRDHFIGAGTWETTEAVHGKKYIDGYQKMDNHAGRQDTYRTTWRKVFLSMRKDGCQRTGLLHTKETTWVRARASQALALTRWLPSQLSLRVWIPPHAVVRDFLRSGKLLAMVVINVSSPRQVSETKHLRLLALHGHGGRHRQFCESIEEFLQSILASQEPSLAIECRCIAAPYPERRERHMWWRYDEGGSGDRPVDWAEMEKSLTKIAEELEGACPAYDGVLGFSQGAEMVHSIALLHHRGDPRFLGAFMPRFVVSFSGAVNPGHFESVGGMFLPRDFPAPYLGPQGTVDMPCLFIGDYATDGWYSSSRFESTTRLYSQACVLRHDQRHRLPKLSDTSAAQEVRRFLARFARQR